MKSLTASIDAGNLLMFDEVLVKGVNTWIDHSIESALDKQLQTMD